MEQPNQDPKQPQEDSIFSDVEINTKAYEKHIRIARIILFVIAGLQLLVLFTLGEATGKVRMFLIIYFVSIAAAFAGFAIWAKYKPYAALLTALIFYLALFILNGVLDPTYFLSGIAIKVAIVAALIMGIRNAKEAEELKKTFGK